MAVLITDYGLITEQATAAPDDLDLVFVSDQVESRYQAWVMDNLIRLHSIVLSLLPIMDYGLVSEAVTESIDFGSVV